MLTEFVQVVTVVFISRRDNLIFNFGCFETGFSYVALAVLELTL